MKVLGQFPDRFANADFVVFRSHARELAFPQIDAFARTIRNRGRHIGNSFVSTRGSSNGSSVSRLATAGLVVSATLQFLCLRSRTTD
jgi:hypothetical protein